MPITTPPAAGPAARCAVHPARPAADKCPVCGRPRCAADAEAAPGGGCLSCGGDPHVGPVARRLGLRALTGAAVLSHLTAVLAGAIAIEYVGVRWFSVIVPFLVGIVCGLAAETGARGARGTPLRLLAVGYAVIAAAASFHWASFSVVSPVGRTLPPYFAAALGAWLWTAPPRVRASSEPAGSRT